MKYQRLSNINTKRDAWVEINLDAIEQNILSLKSFVKEGTKVLAVVKADAYGHGSSMIAPTLLASGVDYLGVASIDEGIELRNNKFKSPILVLGAAPIWAFDYAAQNNISLSMFLDNHIEAAKLTYKKTGLKTKAHIKLDTGMNRIGVEKEYAVEFIKKVQQIIFHIFFAIMYCQTTACKICVPVKKFLKSVFDTRHDIGIRQADQRSVILRIEADRCIPPGFYVLRYNIHK